MPTPVFDYLIQPGWHGSEPEHWQSHWQHVLGASRVDNHDWSTPGLDDWVTALDAAVRRASRPVIVVAHSLGCATVAHHAARHGARVAGALLVAPADVERANAPDALRPFAPLPHAALPFPSLVVASDDDPFCPPPRSAQLARRWGSELVWLHRAGHINRASGHQRWDDGLAWLRWLEAHIARRP